MSIVVSPSGGAGDIPAGTFIRADGTVAFTADESMGGHKLTNVGAPTAAGDAANKGYADSAASSAAAAAVTTSEAYTDGVVLAYIKKDGTVAFTGDQSLGGHKITNLATPTAAGDAATKAYADAVVTGYVKADGTVAFTGDQSMGTHKITNLATPTAASDAATKAYADSAASAAAATKQSAIVLAKWNETDATQFTTVYKGANHTSVTLSRVVGTRSRLLRVVIVATADDVSFVSFTPALPAVDADLLMRFVFRMSVWAFPSAGGQIGHGLCNGLTGASAYITCPMIYTNLNNVQGHRVTAGTLAAAGGTPVAWLDGNFTSQFTSVNTGRKMDVEGEWNVAQPAGAHVAFESLIKHTPANTAAPYGCMPYDDTGDSSAGGTNVGAWAAGWNGVTMSNVCFGIRTGAAGTFTYDLADFEILKHPMDW